MASSVVVSDGVTKTILSQGNGPAVLRGNTITVHCTGILAATNQKFWRFDINSAQCCCGNIYRGVQALDCTKTVVSRNVLEICILIWCDETYPNVMSSFLVLLAPTWRIRLHAPTMLALFFWLLLHLCCTSFGFLSIATAAVFTVVFSAMLQIVKALV